MSSHKLFDAIQVGRLHLKHRIILSPLTRYRSTQKLHVPVLPLVKDYYSQRGSQPGTLLVTEATFIAPPAGGYDNVPGIWSQEQIKAWKEVTDGVHAKGSYIFLQLWALGRTAKAAILEEDGLQLVAPSPIPLSSKSPSIPRELTIPEIQEYVLLYAQAASNAIEAGFDGVELHGANGYLIDQFLQDISNQRTDDYGGDVEKRSRFGIEVVNAVVNAIGADRTGIRLSPWSKFQDMGMADPKPQFSHFVTKIKQSHPEFAYLHVVEASKELNNPNASNDFLREIWSPKPFISANEYTPESAIVRADKSGDLIAFGRHFLANPDLPLRIKHALPLNPYNPKTFYTPAHVEGTEKGYVDYPFADFKEQRVNARI